MLGTNNAHRVLQAQHWTSEIETGFAHTVVGEFETLAWISISTEQPRSEARAAEHQSSFVRVDTGRDTSQCSRINERREVERKKKHCDKVREKEQS